MTKVGIVRKAMAGVEDVLLRAYADGHLFLEADSQAIIYSHLRRQLSDRGWIIRRETPFHDGKPDLAVFHVSDPESFPDFLEEPREFLVAAIEIKHASGLRDDLEKLRRYQARGRDHGVLSWIVYSDHFSSDIHRRNFINQEQRAHDILKWVAERKTHRGSSIVRLDPEAPRRGGDRAVVTRAFADRWWSRSSSERT
ncbi:MAG: hypothetical protein R3C29_17830 [Dehalococcoidia bacterium]